MFWIGSQAASLPKFMVIPHCSGSAQPAFDLNLLNIAHAKASLGCASAWGPAAMCPSVKWSRTRASWQQIRSPHLPLCHLAHPRPSLSSAQSSLLSRLFTYQGCQVTVADCKWKGSTLPVLWNCVVCNFPVGFKAHSKRSSQLQRQPR